MEDLIGLLIFIVFAAFSVIGNLTKKTESSGNGGTPSLKDILTTIGDELSGKSAEPEKKVKKPKVKKPQAPAAVEDGAEFLGSSSKTQPIPEKIEVRPGTALSKEQLRQAVIWKEILDPPVSMR